MDTARVSVGSNGRFVIPLEFRRSLGIERGGELLVRLVEGELRIATTEAAVRHAQSLFRTYVPEGTAVVDDFLQERREADGQDS